MIDLSIIIVNFNAKEFVKNCVKSIKENYDSQIKNGGFEIVVVDNDSKDGSKSELSKLKDIIFIANNSNLGFSKANNIGVKKSHGRYVLFLNPDTLVKKDTLTSLIAFMDSHRDAGAVTCKVLLPNGEIDDASHRGFPTPWNSLTYFSGMWKIFPKSKHINGYYMGLSDMDKIHKVDVVAGAFMLVRREAGEEVGWWDEDYFFYGEDIEFCFDLKEKGWAVYYNPEVSITHFKGVTGGIKKISKDITTSDKQIRTLAQTHRFNAMKIFYKKHYKEKYPFFINFLVLFAINAKMRARLLKV